MGSARVGSMDLARVLRIECIEYVEFRRASGVPYLLHRLRI